MDDEPPGGKEKQIQRLLSKYPWPDRQFVSEVLKKRANGNASKLRDFFLITYNAIGRWVDVTAKKDGGVPYKTAGFLSKKLHYEGERFPVGFILEKPGQNNDIEELVYFDRLCGSMVDFQHG